MLINKQIGEWFDHFHKHPEISWKEVETTKKIAEILTEMNVKHHTFDDVTGVVAEIGEGDRIIAVRADIDALWQEVDGVFRANHSCGHDANISMVIGALAYLKEQELGGRIRFIFQPAEEKGNGAISMIERGAVDGVSHLFGVHLRPKEEIPFGKVSPAIHHGAAIFLEAKVSGEDAHGARPQQGRNALDPIFAIASFIKTIHFSPYEAYSAKLTKIQAGGESLNIIPGNAVFAIDVRAQSNSVLKALRERIDTGIQTIADLHNVKIEVNWSDYTPAAEVSEEASALARDGILEAVGEEGYAPAIITSGSDDFHFYTIHRPEIKAAMIGVGADLGPGLHHPNMTFNHDALDVGARVLATTLAKASCLD
ncbi:amidohydrolase [Sporosarcina thermotolerans]|uniref:Amidohydrolase n=1 Tax=Sporosarcina thermotolerans TaxID=633404 RepID=A0AAW9A8C7_9BACL|nr:amidohydrolase [Sporosarcina thermotolerans]MDW0116888.1 amidohydrolase [Sporosarcina thermotolerans]